jgi:hypothetical protein
MPLVHRISKNTIEYVLSESTRAYIEKMVAGWVAEDRKDPEYRRMIQAIARGDYDVRKQTYGRRKPPRRHRK